MADLLDIDLNSIHSTLVKTVCRLYWFHKKKETPYVELPTSIGTDYFIELRRQVAARFPTLYNQEGLNQYFWFDTHSNPPANIKDVTTGS